MLQASTSDDASGPSRLQAGARLVRAVGRRRALRCLAAAEPLDARTALAWGLADDVAPPGGALEAARALAARYARASDFAEVPRAAKALVSFVDDDDAARLAEREAELFRELAGGPANRAALDARARG